MLAMAFRYLCVHRWQLLRFGIVGVLTFGLNMFLVWLFYGKFGFDYRLAVTFSYLFTVVTHFVLNRSFTYARRGVSTAPDTVKYLAMLLFNYIITLGVTAVSVEIFWINPYFGIVLSTFFTAFSSFLLMKHFVFVEKECNK